MAVRAVNTCCFFRPHSPPLSTAVRFFSRYRRPHPLFFSSSSSSSGYGARIQRRSIQSLFDSVIEELQAMRKRRKRVVSAAAPSSNTGLFNGELLEDRLLNRSLQKGLLLEFKKDSERILLAVAQRPDGKKNWMVSDQNGVSSSIKPQQVTFIVPGIDNFDRADIADFVQKAQDNMDPSLLEFAWIELLEKNKSVTVEELAEIIFGSAEPLESYSAHLLLSKDEVYFSVLETKGFRSIYGPRPSEQVEELIRRKIAKEAAENEFQEFIKLLASAKSMPRQDKPSKSSWVNEEKNWSRIESLQAYALDSCKNDEQRKTAGAILKEMGLAKTASSAVNLLVDIGYFPVHVNLELLKLGIPTDHSEEIISAAHLLSDSYDPDEVYAIDVDEADELDDALSAKKLQDGRIQIWIHVADATRYVLPGSVVDREAMRRGTSVFLPTATYSMFPEKLAMEAMSLRQGEICNAVTVSVVLHKDGSIAECSVLNSLIKPTYMLTYESASELLHLNLKEEVELRILSEAATLRLNWRRQQGAVETASLETRIKVSNPEDAEPSINLYVESQADPAMRLVSEMMILCGEAMATFGSRNEIPLPYRGQPQSDINLSEFSHLPEGPVRSLALVKVMRAAEIDFRKPARHGVLGLPGYVQFTSPIRRYLDLLAHYQVKAFLRGEPLPFSPGKLEGIAAVVNDRFRTVRKLCNSSLRYWILEYLRRQPKEKKYRALVLRFLKDRIAALLLVEVGFQASAWVSLGAQIGDEVMVKVEEAHPRDDVIFLKEVVKG
ncbi:ribonuclease II, chloroplastic/mitochondrial isoform X2 [Lotus japonicus]|uniref:ribonuclease II, chloroplastic/mitochondrial isoform X2 n=1 Tax=Lotus japonicus TaxID=34305 RepID=UPI002582A7DF|nr:ribonuclease II, chloroplastic/mitochondrial isoform X2 [Lotus japonicus]